MIEPLRLDFEVAATPEHAFAVWTRRLGMWWPAAHTVSRNPQRVVMEPHIGGRVLEVGPDGAEHEWAQVTSWEPPHRLELRWHLFFPASEATTVEVTFTESATGTLVRLSQTGWDRLGEAGPPRRDNTARGWAAVTLDYRRFLAQPKGKPP